MLQSRLCLEDDQLPLLDRVDRLNAGKEDARAAKGLEPSENFVGAVDRTMGQRAANEFADGH